MYDVIGDVHGYCRPLELLLQRMGYVDDGDGYAHPDRQAIFVGDLVDRGPAIRETVQLVRRMVERNAARMVMGNHEFNAISIHTRRPGSRLARYPDAWLRKRTEPNLHQHHVTWNAYELTEGTHAEEWQDTLAWFRTLPMWLELDGIRVVHATWDDEQIAVLRNSRVHLADNVKNDVKDISDVDLPPLSDRFLVEAADTGTPLFAAIDDVLKGREIPLPVDEPWADKEGTLRHKVRVQWYRLPLNDTYHSYAMPPRVLSADEVGQSLGKLSPDKLRPYPLTAPPVFVGHYWMRAETPSVLAPNVACVDYSVAKGGYLCAYRWDGEAVLNNDHFIWQPVVTP